jgi:predicted Rossmann-fold nucleotide-binding protein
MKQEIDSASALEAWLASPSRLPAVFQGLDLTKFDDAMRAIDLRGSSFVGCVMTTSLAAQIGESRCLNIPPMPGKPFDPFRVSLYTPEELLAGFDVEHPESYAKTPDAIIYAHYMDPENCSLDDVLARRIHDFSISDALEDNLGAWSGEGVVGIMGGHSVPRGDRAYVDAARLARTLAREGFLIVTGGGPGVMEAGNLGVYLAPHPDDALDVAIAELSKVPVHDNPNYLVPAFYVRKSFPAPAARAFRSVGVPTWFYGHEQPNMFATYLAKYFENSIREAGLLAIASRGVIFAEGSAGTLQEIFENACQVYYRSFRRMATPMILMGADYWNPPGDGMAGKAKKVYPLLLKLAKEAGFGELVCVTDSIDEIAELVRNPPAPPPAGLGT